MGRDFNARSTTWRFEDADGLGMTIGPGDGSVEVGATNNGNVEKVRVMDRGRFDGYVETEDLEQEGSITVRCLTESITSAVSARVRDFIMKTGTFANATSVSNDVWAWKGIKTESDGAVTRTTTYPLCVGTISTADGLPSNTFVIEFRNNGAITVANA